MLTIENLSRRGFLKTSGAAGMALVLGTKVDLVGRAWAAAPVTLSPNVFISIAKDGTVTLMAHRSEMGQGIRTGLAQLLADELEADWAKIVVLQAEGDKKYGDQYTDGSRSIVKNFDRLRQLAGSARLMLEQAAAEQWGVKPDEVTARDHAVHHAGSGRSIGYGELVEKASALPVPPPESVKLKDRKNWKYIGKPVANVDLADITHGKAVYGIDVRLPGMKYAAIQRPPVLRGTIKSYDAKKALAFPGVEKVVEIPSPPADKPLEFKALGGLAVIASNTWAANEGRKLLEIQWNDGANGSWDTVAYRQLMEDSCKRPGDIRRKRGDVEAALKASNAKVVEAAYWSPHFVHAPMEVPAAVADVKGDKMEVWACCQDGQALRKTAAEMIGMPEDKVRANVTLLGGAFGRKSKPDFGAEAAYLSKQVGAPVKVTWTREDDIQNGYYHASAAQFVRAAVDDKGKPLAWSHRTVFPAIMNIFTGQTKPGTWEVDFGLTDLPYDIANIQLESGEALCHVRVGWKRSVQNIFHAFAINSFTHELAVAAGRDHAEFVKDLIGNDRHIDLAADGVTDYFNYDNDIKKYPIDTARLKNVLEVATREAGWGKKMPERSGMGLAVHRSFLTYVATVIEADVAKDGKVTIPRVVMAVDCGTAVNPDRVKAQMEGACIYAMSACFFGEITAKEGRIQQHNFDDYPVARMESSPKAIEVHVVESEAPPGGAGEPGVPPFAPALCNAIFNATGKRIRALPIVHTDLSAT
jgi:isoquinoline 1-oxidoreductase subunit beta